MGKKENKEDKELALLTWLEKALLIVAKNPSVANLTELAYDINSVKDDLIKTIKNSVRKPFLNKIDPIIEVILLEFRKHGETK